MLISINANTQISSFNRSIAELEDSIHQQTENSFSNNKTKADAIFFGSTITQLYRKNKVTKENYILP